VPQAVSRRGAPAVPRMPGQRSPSGHRLGRVS
jgi:hypothetical protein